MLRQSLTATHLLIVLEAVAMITPMVLVGGFLWFGQGNPQLLLVLFLAAVGFAILYPLLSPGELGNEDDVFCSENEKAIRSDGLGLVQCEGCV